MTTQHEIYTPGLPAEAHGFTGREAEEFDTAREEARIAMKVAQVVYDRRTARGWSQTELARRARTTQTVVSRIENSAGIPTVSIMVRLLGALGADLDFVVRDRSEDGADSHDQQENTEDALVHDQTAQTTLARGPGQPDVTVGQALAVGILATVTAGLEVVRAGSAAAFLGVAPSVVAAIAAAIADSGTYRSSSPVENEHAKRLIHYRTGSFAKSTAVMHGSDLGALGNIDIVITPSHDLNRSDAEDAAEAATEALFQSWARTGHGSSA